MFKGSGEDKNVLLTPLHDVPGLDVVAPKGFVMGSSVVTVPVDRLIFAFIRSIFDRNALRSFYSGIFRKLRHEALQNLSANAKSIGANAVLGVSLHIWHSGYGMYEAFAYGTAVEVKKRE